MVNSGLHVGVKHWKSRDSPASKLLIGSRAAPTPIKVQSSVVRLENKSEPKESLEQTPVFVGNEEQEEKKECPGEVRSLAVSSMMVRSHGGKGKGAKSLKGDGTTFSLTAQTIPFMKYKFPDNKPFKFIQSYEVLAFVTQSNASFTFASYAPTSSNINQFSSFAAVFDQYRVSEIELWLLPRHTNPLSVSSTGNTGLLYTVIDYDDASSLSTALAFEQYSNCVVSPTYVGVYRKFKPHIAVANYAGSFTGYSNVVMGWVDCSTTGTVMYGVKIGCSVCDATSDEQVFDVVARYHVEFRNVR